MIGPDIPVHLAASSSARSSSIELFQEAGSPATTIGPTVPTHSLPASSATTPDAESGEDTRPVPIGPAIPPIVQTHSQGENEEEEEEEDYTPALPPDLLSARTSGAPSRAKASNSATQSKRIAGPMLPPHLAGRRTVYDEDDDDDDDYGPAPPPSGSAVPEKSGLEEFIEREERRTKQLEEANKPKALKREEWMLVPPSQSDLLGSIDPTRVKRPRKFAASAQTARDADNSLWTETPAERQQRIADEVAGKRRRVTDTSTLNPEEERELRKKRRYEDEVRRGVEEHTRKVRGGTLLDQHSRSSGKDDDKDEEPPVIWDHGRDMALGGRLVDDKTRDKFIREARGLGDRFGSGKSGGFL